MNRLRTKHGKAAAAGRGAAMTENGRPSIEQQTGFDPALEALFERANLLRADKGLDATGDATLAAQMVLTSIAMDVLCVADRQLHPDAVDAEDAGLAWAYVCFMGARIIAIADQRDDFDNQALILAVAAPVFQFYADEMLLGIVHAGTGLFREIVSSQQQSPAFVDLNDQVHKAVLAFISTGADEAIANLRENYATFARLAP